MLSPNQAQEVTKILDPVLEQLLNSFADADDAAASQQDKDVAEYLAVLSDRLIMTYRSFNEWRNIFAGRYFNQEAPSVDYTLD